MVRVKREKEIIKEILELLVEYGLNKREWKKILNLKEFNSMYYTPQDPIFHPEGNVLEHTLLTMRYIPVKDQESLIAALFHDIGKINTTVNKGGRITSYRHELESEIMTGVILYNNFKDPIFDIEKIKHLVRNHMRIKQAHKMKISKIRTMFKDPYHVDLNDLAYADSMSSGGNLDWYSFLYIKQKEWDIKFLPKAPQNRVVCEDPTPFWRFFKWV